MAYDILHICKMYSLTRLTCVPPHETTTIINMINACNSPRKFLVTVILCPHPFLPLFPPSTGSKCPTFCHDRLVGTFLHFMSMNHTARNLFGWLLCLNIIISGFIHDVVSTSDSCLLISFFFF